MKTTARTIVALLLCGAIVIGADPSPAPAASRSATCTADRRTMANASSAFFVFTKRVGGGDVYYACRWGGKRPLRIGAVDYPDESSAGVDAAGPYAVMGRSTCPKIDVAGCSGEIRVIDVAKRRVRGTWRLPDDSLHLGAIEVMASGAVAWTHTVYPDYPTRESAVVSVYSMDPGGRVRVLATGNQIEQYSLAIGSAPSAPRPSGYGGAFAPVAYWTEADSPRSALLP